RSDERAVTHREHKIRQTSQRSRRPRLPIDHKKGRLTRLKRWIQISLQIRMKHLVVYLLYAVGAQSLCCADVTKLSVEDRKVLQASSRFHEIHSTSDLPLPILALCAGDKNNLAEPGGKWNATDVIMDSTLPSKRLLWAAKG